MHLTPEELIDVAEGTRAEATVPHLQRCDVCRHQIVTLRATMSAAAEVEVPEPSPLFWDHMSQRVREAVAAGESPETMFPGPRWALPGSWRAWAMAGVAAAVMISIYVTAPRTLTPGSGARDGVVASAPLEPFGAADDPSLALFADLTEQMDSEAMTESGWSSPVGTVGTVDQLVANLTDDERLELQRLLNEELAKS
jgi:hypothetical protein